MIPRMERWGSCGPRPTGSAWNTTACRVIRQITEADALEHHPELF